MRIGFDAKRAAQNRTGLGNYSRFIISTLATYTKGNEQVLYIPNKKKIGLLKGLTHMGRFSFPSSLFWQRLCSLWRVWGVTNSIRNDRIDLFHGLSNELPLNISQASNTRSVVTIHDLIFLRYPDYYHWIDRKIYTYKFRKACQTADRIIAISECTKREIISFFKIPEEKIDVVYQGCDAQFKHSATKDKKEEVQQKYDLPQRYILYVGSIENRKNLLLLVKSLRFIQEPISVVAIGKQTPYTELVRDFLKKNNLTERVKFLHRVPFDELPALYQMATTFVYPSFFEGFGIPLLEALNSGVPAIGATGSCLEEAGGPDSLYVDPKNEKELATAIERTLTDNELRERMIKAGKKFALRFEEKKLVDDLMEVYNKTISALK